MIKPLRTYHFFVWRILVLVLPLLAVLAIIVRPIQAREVSATKQFKVGILRSADSTYMVHLEVLAPLTEATCVAYSNDAVTKTFLGTIDTRGKFDFMVRKDQLYFILTDVIHNRELLKQSLTSNDSIR